MACLRLVRSFQRNTLLPSKTLVHGCQQSPFQSETPSYTLLFPRRRYSFVPEKVINSPFDANILRILSHRIELESDYPLSEPAVEFNSFNVQDQPGQQLVTMRRTFGDGEDIKIEAISFDASVVVGKSGEENSGQDMHLHMSLIVDVLKRDGCGTLEFLCSAWPESLEVRKVYVVQQENVPGWPHMGPDFRKLNPEIQKGFYEFLDVRGVNNELSAFLHEYMMNKERMEHLRWLKKLNSFLQK